MLAGRGKQALQEGQAWQSKVNVGNDNNTQYVCQRQLGACRASLALPARHVLSFVTGYARVWGPQLHLSSIRCLSPAGWRQFDLTHNSC